MEFLDNILMVLRDFRYLLFFLVLTGIFMFIFGLFMQIIFLSPRFVIDFAGFTSIIDMVFFAVNTIFPSLIITLLTYRMIKLKGFLTNKGGVGFFTSFLSLFVGACTCSGILPLIAALSFLGVSVIFLTRYINEIRITTSGLILVSFYLTAKDLMVGCKIKR